MKREKIREVVKEEREQMEGAEVRHVGRERGKQRKGGEVEGRKRRE